MINLITGLCNICIAVHIASCKCTFVHYADVPFGGSKDGNEISEEGASHMPRVAAASVALKLKQNYHTLAWWRLLETAYPKWRLS